MFPLTEIFGVASQILLDDRVETFESRFGQRATLRFAYQCVVWDLYAIVSAPLSQFEFVWRTPLNSRRLLLGKYRRKMFNPSNADGMRPR